MGSCRTDNEWPTWIHMMLDEDMIEEQLDDLKSYLFKISYNIFYVNMMYTQFWAFKIFFRVWFSVSLSNDYITYLLRMSNQHTHEVTLRDIWLKGGLFGWSVAYPAEGWLIWLLNGDLPDWMVAYLVDYLIILLLDYNGRLFDLRMTLFIWRVDYFTEGWLIELLKGGLFGCWMVAYLAEWWLIWMKVNYLAKVWLI